MTSKGKRNSKSYEDDWSFEEDEHIERTQKRRKETLKQSRSGETRRKNKMRYDDYYD